MKSNLKALRTAQGLTQLDLAGKLRVSRQTIHAIEKGKYVPSTLLALKLARELCASVEMLFQLEEKD